MFQNPQIREFLLLFSYSDPRAIQENQTSQEAAGWAAELLLLSVWITLVWRRSSAGSCQAACVGSLICTRRWVLPMSHQNRRKTSRDSCLEILHYKSVFLAGSLCLADLITSKNIFSVFVLEIAIWKQMTSILMYLFFWLVISLRTVGERNNLLLI